MHITYRTDRRPEPAVIADLYRRSPLYRPVDDVERIGRMYGASNVVITAWLTEAAVPDRLVGILRGWTDGAFDGYVCDLAVDPDCQRAGVGRELLRLAVSTNAEVQWVLRASKIAAGYYGHLGWQLIENGWFWPRQK